MQKGIQKVRQCTNLKSHSRSISFWRVVLSVCRYEDNLLLLSSLHFPLRFSMISTFLVIATAAGELVVKSGGLETWFDCEVKFLVSDFDVKKLGKRKNHVSDFDVKKLGKRKNHVEAVQVLYYRGNVEKSQVWALCLLSVTNKVQDTGLSLTCHSLVFFFTCTLHTISSPWDGLPLGPLFCLCQVFIHANQLKSWFWLKSVFWKSSCRRLWKGHWGKLMRKEAVGQLQVCLLF